MLKCTYRDTERRVQSAAHSAKHQLGGRRACESVILLTACVRMLMFGMHHPPATRFMQPFIPNNERETRAQFIYLMNSTRT
jgi:hypothetical protein